MVQHEDLLGLQRRRVLQAVGSEGQLDSVCRRCSALQQAGAEGGFGAARAVVAGQAAVEEEVEDAARQGEALTCFYGPIGLVPSSITQRLDGMLGLASTWSKTDANVVFRNKNS